MWKLLRRNKPVPPQTQMVGRPVVLNPSDTVALTRHLMRMATLLDAMEDETDQARLEALNAEFNRRRAACLAAGVDVPRTAAELRRMAEGGGD